MLGYLHTPAATRVKDTLCTVLQVSAELEKALPALQEAEAALNVLTKKDISELKVRITTRTITFVLQ